MSFRTIFSPFGALFALCIMVSMEAHATSALAFEAQGYVIDMVVGDTSKPTVTRISVATPGSTQPIAIPMQQVRIDVFDTQQKALLLSFKNPGNPQLPQSFRLTVKNETGTLTLGRKALVGTFAWGM